MNRAVQRLVTLASALTLSLISVQPAQAVAPGGYWTPERMRAAVPLDLRAASASALRADVPAGEPVTIAPLAIPNGGSAWTGGGRVVSTAGRVFFTYQGRNASCSGNAVTSGNKSTVITAGHCVKLDGAYHTNVAFVPAYDNGNAPYGTWTARATFATPQWHASEDINYDIGAIVVNQLNGQSLTDVVGAQGIAFNQTRAADMYAFGYPAAAPYDGTKLVYCSGRTFNAFLSNGIGMTCDMTGGASGGPWFRSFSEATGTGTVNSVNSYKINLIPTWMFGPYFGADAQNLYNQAQAA
ncbi:trypsin-like serine peptidase [Actinosynnema sp. NPDC059335]|uniref:trypsin-like serine peptidase n=1 Tax=Actinosynnema sp. NPDC059335 TaxID=3346804 RepID=UPI003672239C